MVYLAFYIPRGRESFHIFEHLLLMQSLLIVRALQPKVLKRIED